MTSGLWIFLVPNSDAFVSHPQDRSKLIVFTAWMALLARADVGIVYGPQCSLFLSQTSWNQAGFWVVT